MHPSAPRLEEGGRGSPPRYRPHREARLHSRDTRQPRQVLVVGRLLEQGELQIEDLEELSPGVNRRTLQRDLQGLIERGVAKPIGAARAIRYRLRINGS